MKTITLSDDAALDLEILLSNLSPLATSNAAQKCAALYLGNRDSRPVGCQTHWELRFNRVSDQVLAQLRTRAKFELECG